MRIRFEYEWPSMLFPKIGESEFRLLKQKIDPFKQLKMQTLKELGIEIVIKLTLTGSLIGVGMLGKYVIPDNQSSLSSALGIVSGLAFLVSVPFILSSIAQIAALFVFYLGYSAKIQTAKWIIKSADSHSQFIKENPQYSIPTKLWNRSDDPHYL